VPVLALPGPTEASASFPGSAEWAASSATSPISITKRDTVLSLVPLNPASALCNAGSLIVAILEEAGAPSRRLAERTVFFVVTGNGRSYTTAVITDYLGRACLGPVPLPPGTYTVNAYFGGTIPAPGQPLHLPDDVRHNPATSAPGSLTLANTRPVAASDAFGVNEDGALIVAAPGVLGNDTDADGHSLTAVLVSSPAHGSLVLNSDGSFSYTPNANFNGGDTFTYQASDGIDLSSAVTASITVNPLNDPPVAADDAYSVNEDGTLIVAAPGVLANDTDLDGGSLSVAGYTQPAGGFVALNADGSFTYTPAPNSSAIDSFTYKASDGSAESTEATVRITINRKPNCSAASTDQASLWSPDKTFRPVSVVGVTDPDSGDSVTITITGIFQDEPVGNQPDGRITGLNTAELRAERDGNGNGRVYHIFFTATDGRGGLCSGDARIGVVPHDQGSSLDPIDGGPLYDSTIRG